MGFIPRFKLYESNGITLRYTFIAVQDSNYPYSNKKTIEHQGLRGIGSIIVGAGDEPWDLVVESDFLADDYEALDVLISALETAVQPNTAYILKIDRSPTTSYSYRVKRIQPIEYPVDPENLRTTYQKARVIFRVNSW